MREILFRAKRMRDKIWVEGSLLVLDADSGYYFITQPYKSASTLPVKDLIYNHTHLVNPETVCQYTGMTDKNGVKIFENDIVKMFYKDWGTDIGTIRYMNICARFQYCDASEVSYGVDITCDMEVIGNIFDNPELLKGGVTDVKEPR